MSTWHDGRPDRVHDLLDDIAALVGAPALVEDTAHVLVAYSRHDDPGDPVRASTILGRRAAPEVARWLAGLDLGLAAAVGAVRVPGNADLGMQPRVCVPLRRGADLVGYLWFVDPDGEMSPFDLERAEQAGEALVDVLWHGDAPVDLLPAQTLRAVLAGEGGPQPRVERLLEARARAGGGLLVLALAAPDEDRRAPLRVRPLLGALARHLADLAPLAGVLDGTGVLVCAEPPADGPDVAARVRRALPLAGHERPACAVGVGDPAPALAGLPVALRTARDALDCCRAVPGLGPVLSWPAAGVLRLAPLLLAEGPGPGADLVGRLRAMSAAPEHEHLVRTVETYLDLAGHAQETAAALVLHRTTLYQRLQRFAEVAGVDVRDGGSRTLLHVALKAAHLPPRAR